ncbi:MAG TPA: SDR family NAD(P)-dependent oxidoreductase [Polyangiaceae bacterium]|jgi:NAD(P)-dependent dehydrogenase (short-subunit alcohol dehydrogenase family)
MSFADRASAPTHNFFRPLVAGLFQAARTPKCPDTPRLDGKLAVITGGNAGIGIEISRGLAARGAELIIAARNPVTATAACEAISKETGAKIHHVPLDLTDLKSVVQSTNSIEKIAAGRKIDVLVANAGVAPTKHSLSAQGHELGFAVNVLGHHVFVRRLATSGAFADGRLVVMSAEVYPRATECTSDFEYRGRLGMFMGYSRSKLGSLWFAREFAERHPSIEVYSVHPGVIATGIASDGVPTSSWLLRALTLDVVAGAQTPLFVATQPGLKRGGYYHNKLGLVLLPPTDAALDKKKSSAFWTRLEELAAEFLGRPPPA